MSFLDLLKDPKTFKRAVCKVSGTSFFGLNTIIGKLSVGMPVELEHDQDNKHDKMALKVMVNIGDNNIQVGFVPRPLNRDVCALLLSGVEMRASIIGITPPSRGQSYYGLKK